MQKTLLIIILAFYLVLVGCSTKERIQTAESDNDSLLQPDSELTGARIFMYDKGKVTAEIFARKIFKFDKIDSTMAYEVDIDVLDSTGQSTSKVVGDSAIIREQSGRVDIFGNVELVSQSGRKLKTDYLYWNSKTDEIENDTTHYVELTQGPDDVVTGWGLEADLSVSRFKILKNMKGQIQDSKQLQQP